MLVPMMISGAGLGLAVPAVTKAVVGSVPRGDIGKASGSFSMMRQLGGAFGVAILAAVFAAAGGYTSATVFSDGFAPAIAGAACLGWRPCRAGRRGGPARPRTRLRGGAASGQHADSGQAFSSRPGKPGSRPGDGTGYLPRVYAECMLSGMSVPLTLLGLLEREPSHGYDLKRDYDTYFGRGKPLPYGQVYATLSRLARDGKAIAGPAEHGEGPDRKRYTITEPASPTSGTGWPSLPRPSRTCRRCCSPRSCWP